MTDLAKVAPASLLQRTRDLATMTEEELRRFASEAARDRDDAALWALTEARLTLHGSSGARVSGHTLSAYRHAIGALLVEWSGENLLRPGRNAGVLWVRELEGRTPVKGRNSAFTSATVRVYLSAAKALYAALRWSGATDAAPFADVKVAVDKTSAWEKRDAYTQTEVHWLERVSEGATLLIVLLGAQAGLRVSEMTALQWDDVNLSEGVMRVVAGKGGKTARVYLTKTLTEALEAVRLSSAPAMCCLAVRGKPSTRGSRPPAVRRVPSPKAFAHCATRRGQGFGKIPATSLWWPTTCGTAAWTLPGVMPKPTTCNSRKPWASGNL